MIRPVVAITIGTNHYRRMFSPAAWQALNVFADVIHHDGPEPADKAAFWPCCRRRMPVSPVGTSRKSTPM